MNIFGINPILAELYQCADKTQKTVSDKTDFAEYLQDVKEGSVSQMFSSAFCGNDVSVKVGECNVSSKIWERRDFPSWKYFRDDVGADRLNNWKPTGAEPMGGEEDIQKELRKIDFGEMVVLMPESLQKKMETDSEYARDIIQKVQKWKTDYDRMDNALAASYGENPTLYQMTKSYCIQLDENGNVENYMVVSGGMDTSSESGTVKKDRDETRKKADKSIESIGVLQTGYEGISEEGKLEAVNRYPYVRTYRKYKSIFV